MRHDATKVVYTLFILNNEPVLVCNERLEHNTIPDGWYVYNLRGAGLGDYATIEKVVGVDFVGTLLSRKILQTAEDNYMNIEDCDFECTEETHYFLKHFNLNNWQKLLNKYKELGK